MPTHSSLYGNPTVPHHKTTINNPAYSTNTGESSLGSGLEKVSHLTSRLHRLPTVTEDQKYDYD
jgi:hypothetical protein